MLEEIRPAMFEKIRDLYAKSLDTKNEKELWNNKNLDSSVELYEFREYLKEISNTILLGLDSELLEMLVALESFVEKTGRKFGHIWSENASSGSWGVRWSESRSLLAMYNFELPEEISWPKYDNQYKGYRFYNVETGTIFHLRSVRFNASMVIYEIHAEMFDIDDNICHVSGWNDGTLFSELSRENRKPHFLTFENYKKID